MATHKIWYLSVIHNLVRGTEDTFFRVWMTLFKTPLRRFLTLLDILEWGFNSEVASLNCGYAAQGHEQQSLHRGKLQRGGHFVVSCDFGY